VARYLFSSTNEGNDQRRPRGRVEHGGLDAAMFGQDIHVPEFAPAEDLMIEPDGTRVPAAKIQCEAAEELLREQGSRAGRRRSGLGWLRSVFRRSA
jgi:hypothetical protein